MPRDFPPEYQCGDLRICPSLGTITSASGASVRLGPVNMRVLEALLAGAGDVVSRSDLFKAVWKNQVVSDDALTRCIADIRAELRTFSGQDNWIETLPKRGYRWLIETDLRETSGSTTIVLTVADARTGIAEIQVSGQLTEVSAAFEALLNFIGPASEAPAR
jgi:DNA-binding winged helix-turn-helix (wHTH) protein